MNGAQEDASAVNFAPCAAHKRIARRRTSPPKRWYRMNGGFPAAQENLSCVAAAQAKKSPSWIGEVGASR